ncbi:MAG: hypothetical protein GF411_20410, partial [Candidatus Lokiarchaeota archaeon]|nr:hypothetical protein [Candidatus Lokiarchaeota archaeon]
MINNRLGLMIVLVILSLNLAAIPLSISAPFSDDSLQIIDSSTPSTKDPRHKLHRPTWDEEPTNQTIKFTESFRYDLNATVPGGGRVWYWMRDWIHFSIAEWTGVIIDNNQAGPYPYLSAGVYPLVVYAYDIVVYE